VAFSDRITLWFFNVEASKPGNPFALTTFQHESVDELGFSREGSTLIYTLSSGWLGFVDVSTQRMIGSPFSFDPITGFAKDAVFPADTIPNMVPRPAGDILLTVGRTRLALDVEHLDWRTRAFLWKLD
jgi:hypothetical protein